MTNILKPIILITFFVCCGLAIAENKIDTVEKQGIKRIEKGQQAQQKITALHDSTRSMVDEYQERTKLVDGLVLYNRMMRKQLAEQEQEIAALQNSVGDVAVMERQILPLAASMIESLARFVELDVPFLQRERSKRISKLRALLDRSDVTVAEKTRRVLEAYQIENDYGRTIEAYKDKLLLDDASFDADFLRIGRIGLIYRIVGNAEVGFWNTQKQAWQPLPKVPYKRYIEQGLKIAKQEIAPELISIPINPEQAVMR